MSSTPTSGFHVTVPDTESTGDIYAGLFGWEAQAVGTEASPYTMFTKDSKIVAGMGALRAEQVERVHPSVWASWIIVDNVDETFKKATELGTTGLMEPMDATDAGRMAFVIDPVGAAIGFRQSGTHDGAEVFNEPDTMSWNDLGCRQ